MPESLIKLHKYVAVGDCREYMNKVVDIGGCLGSIDGHTIIIDQTTKGKHYGFFDFYKSRKKKLNEKPLLQRQIEDIASNLDSYVWVDMPEIKDNHYKGCHHCNDAGLVRASGTVCVECSGDGEVSLENDFNDYSIRCKSCDGYGTKYAGMAMCHTCKGTKKHLEFVPMLPVSDNLSLNGAYVELFSDLPDVKVSWHEEYRYFLLKFTGGIGLIMPMRT
jgi:hypothetical protein